MVATQEHVCHLGLLAPDLRLRALALGDVADGDDEPTCPAFVELAHVEIAGKRRAVPATTRPSRAPGRR